MRPLPGRSLRSSRLWFGLVLTAVLALPAPAAASSDDGQGSSGRQVRPAPDFMFGVPRATIGVRGSFVFPRAGSDLFDFFTSQLTIDKGDFRAGGIAADLGIHVTPRVEAVVGFETSRSAHDSEYRDFVDNNLLPIEQSTTLRTAGLTAGVRVAVVPPGRRISQLVWIPRTVTPYLGAGGGFVRYELRQHGDFVDFVDLSVFTTVFESREWTPSAYVSGGIDARVFRQLYFATEGRYTWAAGALGRDFVGFDPIDLSGFRLSAGINLKF